MTPEEVIRTIEFAISEIEWEYPMDYAAAFDTALKIGSGKFGTNAYCGMHRGIGGLKVADIDETTLEDRLMPKSWKCPHCGKKNRTYEYADEIMLEHFKYIQHCEHCGYLHIWHLHLTGKFKKGVIGLLVGGMQKRDS